MIVRGLQQLIVDLLWTSVKKKSQFTNGHSNVSVANPKQSLLILSPERVIGEI